MRPKLIITAFLAIVIAGFAGMKSFTFVVTERDQVVVTRLNKPVRVIFGNRPAEEMEQIRAGIVETARNLQSAGKADAADIAVEMGAGIYFRAPFMDTVEYFPDTLLEYDAEPEQIVTRDKKIVNLDNYARWRIENPLLFRVSVRTVASARDRLDENIYSIIRAEVGKKDLIEIIRTTNNYIREDELSVEEKEVAEVASDMPQNVQMSNPMKQPIVDGREAIMERVSSLADATARDRFGIRVVDVRIKRADLVQSNLQAVFERMRAERSRLSKAYLSMGRREADIIEAETDRRVEVILAQAQQEAKTIRGEGDAEAIRTFAAAFGTNHEFYQFLRTLEVMRDATPLGSELIIGMQSGLYSMLEFESRP
ncbi:MAG: hypothetical protein AMXMBFR84_46410 [Candidatus Hydrogenedentota bacterium]